MCDDKPAVSHTETWKDLHTPAGKVRLVGASYAADLNNEWHEGDLIGLASQSILRLGDEHAPEGVTGTHIRQLRLALIVPNSVADACADRTCTAW